MWTWRRFFSYRLVDTSSEAYDRIQMQIQQRIHQLSGVSPKLVKSSSTDTQYSVVPLELMLLEMKIYTMFKANATVTWTNLSVPCERPLFCTFDGSPLTDHVLPLPPETHRDRRSHLCQNNGRLIGHYKMVYFMQCVRILWPLQPGKLRVNDYRPVEQRGLTTADRQFVLNFHNLTELAKSGGWAPQPYPPLPQDALRSVKSLRDIVF